MPRRRTSYIYATLSCGQTALQTIINPLLGRYNYSYDNMTYRLSAFTDELGHVTTLIRDTNGSRIGVLDALGVSTSYIYNTNGEVTAVVSPLRHRTTQVYDGTGRRSARIDALGNQTNFAFDANSQIQRPDPLGHISTYIRDNMNRVLVSIDPWETAGATPTIRTGD